VSFPGVAAVELVNAVPVEHRSDLLRPGAAGRLESLLRPVTRLYGRRV
jgi:hypothetical protein